MPRKHVVVALIVIVAATTASAQIQQAFPNLTFTRPVEFQHPGDGTNRVFVVEQRGVIWWFDNDPTVTQRNLFLDIEGPAGPVDDSSNEMGLLGLAFHPDFENNGYFYVNYTAGDPRRTVVSRFQVEPTNPDTAVVDSEFVLIEINQPFTNHNGGKIAFGDDGYLYISVGDGGSANDPNDNGQNTDTLLGSILRIDVDTTVPPRNYGIPSDNPLVGVPGRDEIYAYGLRNTWRFSFDSMTGWLWAGDVGQDAYEEIDVIVKGGNYGWKIMEGDSCRPPTTGCDTTGLELPVWTYAHPMFGSRSVTGGHAYRGLKNPEYFGAYIYADFATGEIWELRYDGSGPAVNSLIIDASFNVAAFGVDDARELYICGFDGKIYRFIPTVTGVEPPPFPSGDAGELAQNFPNPFNPETTIEFVVNTGGNVTIDIFDTGGRRVRTLVDRFYGAGRHTVGWDGTDGDGVQRPSGVYFYRLRIDGRTAQTRRMVLLK